MKPLPKWIIPLAALVIGIVAAIIFLPQLLATPPKMTITLTDDLTLPPLTGPFPVGRTTVHMVNEDQPALPRTDAPREWVVTLFYPARPDADATPGPYADDALKTAYTAQMLTDDSAGALDHLHAHAFLDALAERGPFPVLLFSPGGGEQPLFYTALLEQVSSFGYIVVAVPEPFDTPVIPLPDGRVLTSDQMTAWCEQDEICTNALKEGEAGMQAMMDQMKDNRAKDMQFTLDQLARLNREHPILTGVLDLERVGVFGHSFGGASAVRVAQLDARVDALAVLDSDIFLVIPEESAPLSQPVLYLTTANIDVTPEERAEIAQRNELAVAYLSQHAPYYLLQIAGTTHQSIQTDAMFLAPYISIAGEPVTLFASDTTPDRLTEILSIYVIVFFEHYLKGLPQPLLTGPSEEYPEVMITSNP